MQFNSKCALAVGSCFLFFLRLSLRAVPVIWSLVFMFQLTSSDFSFENFEFMTSEGKRLSIYQQMLFSVWIRLPKSPPIMPIHHVKCSSKAPFHCYPKRAYSRTPIKFGLIELHKWSFNDALIDVFFYEPTKNYMIFLWLQPINLLKIYFLERFC